MMRRALPLSPLQLDLSAYNVLNWDGSSGFRDQTTTVQLTGSEESVRSEGLPDTPGGGHLAPLWSVE
jgi:hypothetical protein